MSKFFKLKKTGIFVAVLFFLVFNVSYSQTYNMGNGTINGCSGTFYDPGGGGNYGDGANFTQTICSTNGQPVYIQFSQFQLESGFDNLSIYNGTNTTNPNLIGTYTGSTSPGSIQGTGTCITLVFTSDGSVTYSGWVATIGCGTLPPPPPAPPGDACNTAVPFCTGTTYNFPAGTNQPPAPAGPNYGCLFSQPNPVWYFLQVQNGGAIDITLSNSANVDIDFILWGPFTSAYGACLNNLTANNTVDCSYSTAATEYVNITGATTGQYYMLLITNFSNQNTNFTFSQTGGNGTTNCNILCNINSMTGVPGACNSATNTYQTTGNIQTYAPPNSGTLTISSSCGGSVVYGPPFTTSTNYTITNMPATGTTCTLTAQYSADPLCTYTMTYTSPAPCNTCTATATNTGPYCAGSTIQLNATGGGTYSWSGPGGYTATGASPTRPASTTAMSGVYTVTVTSTSGATCTATSSVTVNPIPVITATNTGPFCVGSTIQLNATGGGTYSWSGPGGFTSTAQNPTRPTSTTAMSGVYTVTVTTNGCTATATTSVTVNPIPTPTANNTGPYCPGATISLLGTGGGTYSWSGPGAFTSTAQNPTRPTATTAMSGVYTLTVTVNGCTATATTSVTVNPLPTPTASNTGPYCAGSTIALTATGGGTYAWSGPSGFTSTSATPNIVSSTTAMSGVYTVTVTVNGCTATATTSVTVNPLPVPTATNTGPYCAGTTIALTATGGGTYAWSGPSGFTSTSATPTIAVSTTAMSGAYTVTVTTNGCTATATTSVTVNPLPAPTASNTGPYCPAATIALTATGGGTYAWSGPAAFTSTSATPTIAASTTAMSGVYTVTVTVSGCTATATTSVTVNPLPVPTATNTGPYCPGATIQLNGTGGGTYSWTGPGGFSSTAQNPTRPTATTTMSGVYTVTVTANGCTATATTSVTVNPLPTPTASNTGPYCAGATIALTATGGGTYAWSGPNAFTSTSATPTIAASTTAMSGVYTVTVTVAGCTATATTSVTVNPLPVPTASNTGPYCPGATIQFNATGGGTYAWSGPGGFTSASQNPIQATATTTMSGVYTVTVTVSGCTATATTSVTVNPLPTPTASNTGPYCPGATIQLNATGGGTYSWSGPGGYSAAVQNPTRPTATTAMSGVYTVTVTTNGCTATATTSVTVNPLPVPTATNTGPYCPGSTVQLNATGGGTYSWSGPNSFTSTSQNPTAGAATVLNAGAYTVTVTASGCTATATTTVVMNATLVPGLASNSPVCAGTALNLTCSNGVTWAWTGPNGFTSASQNPTIAAATTAASGTYSATVTDASGCTGTATVAVVVNPLPTPTASNTGPYCAGATIALTATGGGTYSWSGPNTFTSTSATPTIAASTTAMSGVYTVTVTVSGCTATATTSVTVNPLPTPTASNTGPYCAGTTIALTATGGGTYSWSGPSGFTSTSGTPTIAASTTAMSGVYTVTVTVTGCTAIATTSVTVNPLPAPTASNTGPYCAGATISLTATAGGTYAWSGPSGFTSTSATPTIAASTPAMSGAYTVTVTLGTCTATATTSVTVNPLPVPTATNTGPYCLGTPVQLNATGGGTYSWSGPNAFTSTSQNPSPGGATASMAGVYTVTVTLTSCTATATTTITINPSLVPGLAGNSPVCAGNALNLTCSNGVTWNWTGPNGFTSSSQNPSISPATTAASGTYSATVTDASGCVGTGTIAVTVNPLPNVTVNSTVICNGQTTATLTANNASTYSWTSGTTPSTGATVTATPTVTSTYTVTGTDANGCVNTAVATVTVNPLPVATATNTGPYCPGVPVQLNSSGGGTYSWSGPSGFTSTSQNPALGGATAAMGGVYTVTVTLTSCTATATTSVTVNANLIPGIASNSPVCAGNALNLTCANGVSWSWTGPNGFTSSSQNPSISPATTAASGTYSATVTDANGCVGTGTLSVVVNPLPNVTVNSVAICLGQATATLTANNATSYSWTAGTTPSTGATVTATPTVTSTYTVTGTDANSCVNTAVATVTVNPLPVITVSNTGPYCVAATIQLNATGGTAYAWTGPNGFTNATANPSIANATTAQAGQYNVIVTDANGCTATGNTTVVVNTALTPGIASNSPICEQQALNLTCSNGVSWSWTGPNGFISSSQNPTINPASTAATGTYSISLTDANGCVGTGTLSVVVNPLPNVTVNSVAICLGQATATLTANNATSYSWTSGTTPSTGATVTATPGATTTYTVTGTDVNGCVNTAVATVTVNPLPVITVSNTGPYCVAATVQLNATGGTTYAWTGPNGFTNATANPSIANATTAQAGQYDVTVTDANGCTATGNTTVVVNTALVPAIASNSPVCDQQALNLTCANGVSWSWTGPNGFTSATQNPTINPATPAATGTYSISLTDTNGCVGTGTLSVVVNPLPNVTVNSVAICLGQATATLTANNATSYSWTAGTTPSTGVTVTATPGATTTYTVTGTDANGCVNTAVATVTVNPLPVITVSNTGPYCVAGTIQLNATGGTTYAWNGPNGFTNATASPSIANATTAEAGQYDVIVTDANGCTATGNTTVVVNTALVPAIASNSPICEQQALNLTCANGVSWAWTGPNGFTDNTQNPTINPATPAATGTYSISLTDANGCVGTGTLSVVVNPLPNVTVNSVAICLGQATATLTANNASTYSWSAGTNSSTGATVTADPVATTNYTVTGTDINGCVDTAVATVTVNPLPAITVSNTGPYCVAATIQLNATGGTTYAWTGPNGFTNATASPSIANATTAEAGQYDVIVTDANGCTATGNTTVVVNTALTPAIASNSPICEQQALNLTCTNGVSWSWTGPNGFADATQNPTINPATPAATGTYSITLTDANGCIGTGTLLVFVNPLPLISVSSATICVTQATATLTASGGLNYSWTAGVTPNNIDIVTASPAVTTTYTVTGTDANGCSDTAIATILVNPLPVVTVNSPAICPTFTANLTANGATTYTWTSGTTPTTGANVIATPASTTQYTVTGTDANGCVSTAVSTVTVNAQLVVDAGVDDTVCVGDNISLLASGPAGTTYTWNPGNLSGASQTIPAAATTTYTVSGIDLNGCTGSDMVTITVPAAMVINAGGFAATCNGVCDGQLVVLATPNSGPFSTYTYSWTPNGYNTPSVNGVCAGNYSVTVTNNAGCVATTTATVTEPTAVTASVSATTPASCNNACDGTATIGASGGTGAYTYTWSSLGVGSLPTNLCAGSYTCTVTDANNCSVPVTVSITQPAAIAVAINPVATICIGQNTTLTSNASGGNGGYVYTWSGGTTPNNTAAVTATPTLSTNYTVSVTDVNGCTAGTATINVTVNPPLSVTASADVTLCVGQSANMSANASGGNGSYQYNWATGTTPGTGQAVSATPGTTVTYTVSVTDGCGTPAAVDSILVIVNPLPVLTITPAVATGCAPLCLNVYAGSTTPVTSINWVFTDGQVAGNNDSVSVCFNTAGVFGGTISVTDANGCQNTFTNNSFVTVYPVPAAEFAFDPQPASEANPLITFTDLSTGATITDWLWTFGNAGDSSSTLQNPVFDYGVAGSYNASLVVTSNNGCSDTVSHLVVIDPEFILYVPNAFSPNDDGVNETFFPKGIGVDTDEYQMWIYDRWGNMIFTTDEWSKGWNGIVQGKDEVVMQDVYVWKIKLKTWKGEKKSYVGHVTVVK
jgi:gliding motility-associated-like protein